MGVVDQISTGRSRAVTRIRPRKPANIARRSLIARSPGASARAVEIAVAWGSGSSASPLSIGAASSPRAANGSWASDSTPAAVATSIGERAGGLGEEGGLADPGFPAEDERSAASGPCAVEQRLDPVELGFPSDQHACPHPSHAAPQGPRRSGREQLGDHPVRSATPAA